MSSGFTDIEIRYERVHVIVEAKRGWTIHSAHPLESYRPRLLMAVSGFWWPCRRPAMSTLNRQGANPADTGKPRSPCSCAARLPTES